MKLKTNLNAGMEKLKSAFPFKKWLHPADYHITMAFLGDTSEAMEKEALNIGSSSACK